MRLAAMQEVIGRLLTEPGFAASFFSPAPGEAAPEGLTPEEYAALRRIDASKLRIASEGYRGKRIERVLSAFPLTLAALESAEPGFGARYVAATPFPATSAEESLSFVRHVLARPLVSADARRLVEDLLAVERALLGRPFAMPVEDPPQDLRSARPRQAPSCAMARLQGPLHVLSPLRPSRLQAKHPAGPTLALVRHSGDGLRVEALDAWEGALLDACDGAHAVDDLVARFGGGATARLDRWHREGVLGYAPLP